jgi:probable F420-dependent oxidoreductase
MADVPVQITAPQEAAMSDRKFRFGVVAGLAPTAREWLALAGRAEALGYDTFLTPDTHHTFSPFPALAAAAAATTSLRVGTYVLSAPNRTPGAVARESASLDVLSGGRFELGVGAGRSGAREDALRLGVPFGTPGERVGQLADTIRAVKESASPLAVSQVQRPHPPILVAGSGSRVLRLAAREADIFALGLPADSTEDDFATKLADLRHLTGSRFDDLELTANLAAVAEDLDQLSADGSLPRQVGGDPGAMAVAGGIAFLIGTPTQLADTLRRRRDRLGISYFTVNAAYLEQLAPVVDRLAGT